MMNRIFTICFIVGTFSLQAQKVTLKWKTDTLLRVPESVLFDGQHKVLYVANINGKPDGKDGNGFISKVGLDGKIENLNWATGLDAPKGMGLYKDKLYVADISRVVVIDVASGKVLNKIEVDGAVFLNDITVDKKGNVFISDTRTGKIHTLQGDKAVVYFESTDLNGVNGLLAEENNLYVLNFANGNNYKLTADKKLNKVGVTSQGADGVVEYSKGSYLVSSWHGEVYLINTATGEAKKILDTKDQKQNAADIDYDPKTKTLYVPTFFANSVMAYEVK